MSKLIKCKACEKEISKNAKTCPHCGESNKKSRWLLKFFIGIFVILAILALLDDGGSPSGVASTPKPAESDYSAAISLNYRAASLEQIQKGQLLQVGGKVLQVSSSNTVRLATGYGGAFDYTGDDILLIFPEHANVVEEDILYISGRYDGVISYETVLGAERTIPKIYVDYFKVTKPRQ